MIFLTNLFLRALLERFWERFSRSALLRALLETNSSASELVLETNSSASESASRDQLVLESASESASRDLNSELPLGMSPPSLSSALDRFNRRHRPHRAGALIAFCCSPMLFVKISSHSLHRHVILAGKLCWLTSGKEPVLFSKDLSMALHVVHPSLAPSGLVHGINNSPRFAFHPTWCSPLRELHYHCYPARPCRPWRCGLVVKKRARGS